MSSSARSEPKLSHGVTVAPRAGRSYRVLLCFPRRLATCELVSTTIRPPNVNRLQRLIARVALLGVVAVPGLKANAQAVESSVVTAVKPLAVFSSSVGAFRDSLVARARAQIGTRYKLGGTAPERGFDCSGLVRFVVRAFDITLPRTARQQATMGTAVPRDLAAMKPGDLLTFGKGKTVSHIGIYVGGGRFVHASTGSRRVIETSLVGTRSPLIKQWKGVRRVAEGVPVKLRDSLMSLAMADSLH